MIQTMSSDNTSQDNVTLPRDSIVQPVNNLSSAGNTSSGTKNNNLSTSASFDYKKEHRFETRLRESTAIKLKYPDRIPVICEVNKRDAQILKLDKKKYLVPTDLTMGQFKYVLRKRIKLAPEEALFIFVNGTIPPIAVLMKEIYKTYADADGYVYFSLCKEATFGCN